MTMGFFGRACSPIPASESVFCRLTLLCLLDNHRSLQHAVCMANHYSKESHNETGDSYRSARGACYLERLRENDDRSTGAGTFPFGNTGTCRPRGCAGRARTARRTGQIRPFNFVEQQHHDDHNAGRQQQHHNHNAGRQQHDNHNAGRRQHDQHRQEISRRLVLKKTAASSGRFSMLSF